MLRHGDDAQTSNEAISFSIDPTSLIAEYINNDDDSGIPPARYSPTNHLCQHINLPANPLTAPADPPTALADPPTAPANAPTALPNAPTATADPPTAPADPPTAPADLPTAPADPPTAPADPPTAHADLPTAAVFICISRSCHSLFCFHSATSKFV
jgi:hypothetical protein